MQKFFNPKSIAIIGASNKPGKIGHDLIFNLKNLGFRGKVYPVNPKEEIIVGLKNYKKISDLPKTDLAVIAVPSSLVPLVLENCGKKEIKNIVIISSGFRETGKAGEELENKLIKIQKKYQQKIIGPNCLGLINTDLNLNASFAEGLPQKGNISLISQSGAMAVAIMDWASKKNFGFSKIVSLGNKIDIDTHNVLNFLEKDQNTKIIMCYLEDFKKGQDFLKIAKKVSQKKPIIIIKGGRSSEGQTAASSHTGALASEDKVIQAVFQKANIIQAETIEDFFDYAQIFNFCPILRNKNIAIITNAGGPGILTTDTISKSKLDLAKLDSKTLKIFKSKLPQAASLANPIDIIGDARADRYKITLEAIMQDKSVDGVIIILTPQAVTQPLETAKIIVDVAKNADKPIATSFIGFQKIKGAMNYLNKNKIAHFNFPERSVLALEKAYNYYHRQIDLKKNKSSKTSPKKINHKLNIKLQKNQIAPYQVSKNILDHFGLPCAKESLAKTDRDATQIAKKFNYPVVAKIISPEIIHKTEIGGIRVNIKNEKELKEKFQKILSSAKKHHPQAKIEGVLIQKMMSGGEEVIIGAKRDHNFGPLISFGLGGIYTNILEDVSFRLAPLDKEEALQMIHETKVIKILQGARGKKSANIKSLVEILVKTSQIMEAIPEIQEIDFNPVLAFPKQSYIVDAKIMG